MQARTVGDLIDILSALPPQQRVVLSADPDGNGHYPLGEVEEAMVDADDHEATYLTPEAFAEERANEHTIYGAEDEPPPHAERVVLLWPMHWGAPDA